ncbi:hypothetical protein JQN58_15680 [Aneurinibacillus sp. BA2021]|nr:hypothetical protein [Aneurinibacillus sp. BA2021]
MDQYGDLEPGEEYLYEYFVFHLHQGHEFDFFYQSYKYAISYGTGKKRYFTKYGDADNFQSFDTVEELLENLRIDNKTIKEIWKDIEVVSIY